jgi:hypothetical protein
MTIQNKLVQGGVWTDVAKQQAIGDLVGALTANNTTQATATAITSDIAVFTTVAASGAAVLPGTLGAGDIVVFNGQATNALLVFCPVGGTMNGTSNASASIPVSKTARFVSADGLAWYALISA